VEETAIVNLKIEVGVSMSEGILNPLVKSLAFLIRSPIHGARMGLWGRGGGPSGVGYELRAASQMVDKR
jgi:hypothetical protein